MVCFAVWPGLRMICHVALQQQWTLCQQNFKLDTFLMRVPFEAHPHDQLRIKWRIYSLIHEDLAPTTIMNEQPYA